MTTTPTSSANNVNYMGIEERNPRETYIRRRPPTPQDFRGYKLGDRWVDKSAGSAYILTSKINNVAFWIPMGGGAGAISTINGVPPVAGNINLTGAGAINVVAGPPGIVNINVKVDGVTISIIGDQLVVNTAAILSTLQFNPDTGANVSPVVNIIQVPGFGGIETLNGGAGILQIEDRRWVTAFVVDPSAAVGTRGTFTTIGAALAAAVAPAVIYIRPGTYVESLTFSTANIYLYGITAGDSSQQVRISGDQTISGTGIFAFENIHFIGTAALTIGNAGAGNTTANFFKCTATSNPGTAILLTSAAGSGGLNFQNGLIVGNGAYGVRADVGGTMIIDNSTVRGITAAVRAGGSASQVVRKCQLFGTTANVEIATATATLSVENCEMVANANNPCVNFTAAGAYRGLGNIYQTSSATTNYVAGAAGTYRFADEKNTGTAINIAAGITQTPFDWKPYGTAGTSVTAVRGTAGYDSTQFTVTNGFVQLVGATTGTATTVGAATADVITFAMPTVASVVEFDVIIAAFNAATPAGGGYAVLGAVRTTGVASVVIGTPDVTTNEEAALLPADVDIVAVGNNAVIRVTGVAGLTINWRAQLRSVTAP